MPQPTKNAAKKRPVPTRRSPVIKTPKASSSPHSGAEDDVKITALKLPRGELSPEMDAYFKKCDEKLGFVPNVLKAFAFDDAKLQAFVDAAAEIRGELSGRIAELRAAYDAFQWSGSSAVSNFMRRGLMNSFSRPALTSSRTPTSRNLLR